MDFNKEEIKINPSTIGVYTFTTNVAERQIKFEVLKFKDSIFVWIGEKHMRVFNDLSLSTLFPKTMEPIGTKIMGDQTNLTSSNIANKLSKKLSKPVYVSFNLVDDRLTVAVVNSKLAEEIKNKPQFF